MRLNSTTSARMRLGLRNALGLALAALVLATPAQAYVTRSCQAAYMIKQTGTDGDWIRIEFSVRGKDFLNPNAARTDARRRLERCLDAHWDNPRRAAKPAICIGGADVGLRGYPFDALHDEITALACAKWPGLEMIALDVQVHVSGNTGCVERNRWAIGIVAAYPVHCPVVRQIIPGPYQIAPTDR